MYVSLSKYLFFKRKKNHMRLLKTLLHRMYEVIVIPQSKYIRQIVSWYLQREFFTLTVLGRKSWILDAYKYRFSFMLHRMFWLYVLFFHISLFLSSNMCRQNSTFFRSIQKNEHACSILKECNKWLWIKELKF